MSDETQNLALPLVAAEQGLKHIPVNEAFERLDTLVQLNVLDDALTTPPGSPDEGDRYIVASGASGDWDDHDNEIALYVEGAWLFHTPQNGWRVWVESTETFMIFHDDAWHSFTSFITELQELDLLGIGTTADATNPFSAKLNKALWTAKTAAEGGDGDLRYTMNKETASDVVSLLLQRGFSGRAEIGLIGDDDLTFKVSADGSTWSTGLVIDKDDGTSLFKLAGSTVASAATTDIGAATTMKVDISGTTTITSFGTVANCLRLIRFTGALTLTHNATSLILPGGANITTAAGDTALVTSTSAGNWTVRHYARANGKPVIGPASTDITDSTSTGRSLLTAASQAAARAAISLDTGNTVQFTSVGVGASPSVALHVTASTAKARVQKTSNSGYAELEANSNTQMTLSMVNSTTGQALIDLAPLPSDGTSTALFRFFRATSTSGNVRFDVHKGDGTSATNHSFYGNSNSYLCGDNGNLGIGVTSSITEKLVVGGNIKPSADNTYTCGISGGRWSAIWAATGTIQTSDARQKKDIEACDLGLDFIKQLRPVSYVWKVGRNIVERVEDGIEEEVLCDEYVDEDGNVIPAQIETRQKYKDVLHPIPGRRRHYGLIAQEVKGVIDTLNLTDFAGYVKTDPADPESEEGLRYDQFIAPLIRAVQELSTRITSLESAAN